jgi:uncharacterized caspase-like protein
LQAFLTFLVVVLLSTAAFAERRVALVIGNSAYVHAPALQNPVNDATAISAALERLGFQVQLGTDLDITGMRDTLRRFSLSAEGADLALFFYAGHGLQVAGNNYLLPVDALLEREGDLDFAAIELGLVLKQLELASGHSVILLDACRDNPFETRLSRSMGTRSTGALGRGLAPVDTAGGALIGFATDPGEVAYDGAGDHSPFTAALLSHIETPGLEINAMLTRVRAEVVQATGRLQRPWSTSSLLDEVFLATPAAPEPDPVLAEVEMWKAADQAGTVAALEAYLAAFPDGLFAEMAGDRLAELTVAVAPLPAPLPDPLPELLPEPLPEPPTRSDAVSEPACADCPATVSLSGGRFLMGSASEAATPAERPVTEVTLAPFALTATEITVGAYRRFIDASGYRPPRGCYVWTRTGKMRLDKAAGWASPGFAVSDDMPVACINWNDARAYAVWLSGVSGRKVRLPTEAELEYAIRAGTEGDYPFDPAAVCSAANGADASSRFGWRNRDCQDGFAELAPAGAFPANALGLHDTTGSLWEWAADCWSDTLDGQSDSGKPRASGRCEARALRGGSWDDPVPNLRAPYRVGIPAKRRQANVGFRVVIEGG